MKKRWYFAVGVLAALCLSACGAAQPASPSPFVSASVQEPVGLANPFVDCETMDEAAMLAGFEFTLPETDLEGYSLQAIRVIEGELIEVVYTDGTEEFRFRKAVGGGDISGDYNTYDEEEQLTVGEVQVDLRGSEGAVHVAVWEAGGYAYAVTSEGGLTPEELATLLADVA